MSKVMHIFASESGFSTYDLLKLIRTAPRRYKVYQIPKRSGGMRTIAQPARELKILQRILIDKFLSNLPVHASSFAYVKDRSILDNAKNHAGNTPILKMDFSDFFPSIRSDDWDKYCRENKIFDEEDINISSQILFRQAKGERLLKLSIGAPSSPILSNILMYQFDSFVCEAAQKRKINYSRYADDLTFSGQKIGMLRDMIKVVETATHSLKYPHLKVNHDKTVFVTPNNRRMVTGLVLANDGSVGLGRDKKRLISTQVHRAVLKKLSLEDLKKLSGNLAYASSIEPEFIVALKEKYGETIIEFIKRSITLRE